MGLRILEDDPGYALLEFDRGIDSPTLKIAVRSHTAHPDEHLGAAGVWQKAPYYFTANRVSGTANSTRYRIGPEIVNYMLDADSCEIATDDRSIIGVADWVGPIPQMLKSNRSGSIYVEPGPKEPSETQDVGQDTVAPPVESDEKTDYDDEKKIPPPFPFARPVIIAAGLGVVALLGLIFLTGLKCTLFGVGCPVDLTLPTAMTCGQSKIASDPCAVKACFETYLSKTSAGAVAPDAKQLIDQGDAACRKITSENAAASEATACASTARSQGSVCDVRQKCVATYLATYPDGPHRAELESLAQQADSDCAVQKRQKSESEAAKKEQDAADAARKCAAEKNSVQHYCLVEPACLTDYRSQFPNGKSRTELDGIGATARAACQQAELDRQNAERLKRQQEEDAARAKQEAEARAFEDASLCAKTNACVADACFAEYERLYADGAHAADADRALADAKDACEHPPLPAPSIPEGTYTSRTKPGCGDNGQFGLEVTISAGHISWQHDMPPADGLPPIHYQWDGTIDAYGSIRASVGNSDSYSATGTFNDSAREVQLRYPNCSDPITLVIGNRIH